ncbi:MAG: hypothetical protein ABFE08_19030 [Armatimonadia bacterium]
MKLTWAAVMACCLTLATIAGAQTIPNTPRAMGMGNAVIGVADDAGAWSQNPAGLGALHVATKDGNSWGHDIVVGFGEINPGNDDLAINWSGWNPTTTIGLGAGYNGLGHTETFGAGFGMSYNKTMFSWGVDVMRIKNDSHSDTALDLGAMYRFIRPGKPSTRLGLKISDIGDSTDAGPQVGLGVSWTAAENLMVAVDVADISGKSAHGPFINAGAEYRLGKTNEWSARGGLFDAGDGHKLTLGVGLVLPKVRLDLGYMNTDSSSWMVGAGFDF